MNRPYYDNVITTLELNSLIAEGECRIFDVRHSLADLDFGQNAYNKSHLPQAIFAHIDRNLSGEIIPGKTGRHPLPAKSDWIEQLGKWGIVNQDKIIVYDQNHGGIAARFWWMMKWVGHENVAVLEGGFQKWEKEAFTLTDEIPKPEKSNYKALKSLTQVVTLEEVKKIANSTKTENLIDSRTANRYAGIEEPIDPIAGHIPQAKNRPFINNLNEDFTWKSNEELRATLDDIYKDKKELIFYCGSGVTACHNILAINKAYGIIPKLYPGSWSEYLNYL